MIRLLFILIPFLGLMTPGHAQPNQPVRYRDCCFGTCAVSKDIKYGENVTQAGIHQNLFMDVYQPPGDTATKRPLIILAHGGYFLFGSKEMLAADCDSLAQAGFVVASIDYRLIDVEESVFAYKRAVVDAVNDMKAAVRYFKKDAATENFYRVDTNNIFIGGYSAGAITSLHYAYANTRQDAHEMGGELMLQYLDQHGGEEGDSGNPGYSTTVKGVINIAGSLHRAVLVDAGEPILFSVHGTADDVVPYHAGVPGRSEVTTEGSGLIHARANEVGLVNKLITIEGADHGAYFFDCLDCRQELRKFIYENLE